MAEIERSEPNGVSRRTVTKAMAWAVPVVAVSVTAPMASASAPPPPTVDWSGACGTTGSSAKGCGPKNPGDSFNHLQVPVTLSNPTPGAVIFQITGFGIVNGNVAPGVGNNSPGVENVYTDNGTNDNCNPIVGTEASCSNQNAGNPTTGNVLVPAGGTLQIWVYGKGSSSASNFSARLTYQFVDKATCTVISTGSSPSLGAISPANC
ncbi:hypothetical protein ACWGST_12405 [Agromyces sp. NPDC055520]